MALFMSGQIGDALPAPLRRLATSHRRIGLQTVLRRIGLQTVKGRTARQRRSWAVPPCCSLGGDRSRVHATRELRRGGACRANAASVPPFGDLRAARCRDMMLLGCAPAPALGRGASIRQPEGCSDASWRELCGVKLPAHEQGSGGLFGKQGNEKGPRRPAGALHLTDYRGPTA